MAQDSKSYIPGLGSVHKIQTDEVEAAAIDAAAIATGAVGSAEIATDAVEAAEIAAGAVGTSEIATDGVDAAEIAAGAVGTSEIGANVIVTADIDVEHLQYVEVALSAANIIAMFTTPVTLIAAPGASKIIDVESITFKIARTATAFSSGGAVSIKHDGQNDVCATIASTVITGSSGTTYTKRIPVVLSDVASASIENLALKITNATGVFADGTGTAVVAIHYRILTL